MDSFTLRKVEFSAVRRILSGFCRCAPGKALALRVGASRNPSVIARWLDETEQMVAALRDVGLPPTGGVADVTDALARARPSGGATGEDYAAIASTLEAAAAVRTYLLKLPEQFDRLVAMAGGIGEFDDEVAAIRGVVGPDGEVLDDASPRLAELRGRISEIGRRIHEIIHGYLRRPDVARLLQNVSVTMHGDRYVLPVRVENRGRLPGVVHRASNTGATVFIEPNACVELNNELTDLHEDERREVQRLLNQLALTVQARAADVAATLKHLAQIDVVAAKAQYAYQFEMTRPEMSQHGPVNLRQVRHPLLIDQAWRQEREGVPPAGRHPVVPIDVRLGEDFDLLVITGSNTGGKTVALKTAALASLMAQAGMFIPAARGSALRIFRDVYIDVGDEQSLEQSLSTFGAHVKRLQYVLRKADGASLVLLDELGAGTDPEEGGAIGQAVLDELRRIGALGMITTHLSVLKAYAQANERVDNASVEFDTETLSPTYRLLIGRPGESHAITVADHLGLPKRLVKSARKHLSAQGRQFHKAIRATGAARQAAEEARAEAQSAQVQAETQQEAYEAKLADLHRLQEEFRTWLARLPELRPGDEVHVPSMGKTGHLARLELHRQVAVVDVDHLQVEVPLRELAPDLGQDEVRKQIADLRKEILAQAQQAEQDRAEAKRLQDEYHQSVKRQKERARQFDTWLSAVSRMKVGDEVPIARKPGRGKLVSVDLPGLRATLATDEGELTLSLQDLFPQTGPFSPHGRKPAGRRRKDRRGRKGKNAKREDKNRPMQRGGESGRKAERKREELLETPPGEQVFVVPFHKKATLVRVDAEKAQAVVQSGVFEMQLPLSDLEPLTGD